MTDPRTEKSAIFQGQDTSTYHANFDEIKKEFDQLDPTKINDARGRHAAG
ncbi:MAG TPA: hypothetical protein VLJ59_01775 [Mycobacteriales bacterium]|nr:hypothetical protein [Mycobacteriales bacterium]